MPFISSFSNTGRAKATFPGQAGTPSIVSQASGQVGISWAAPSFSGGAPITDYKIEYSTNSGSTWTEWVHVPSAATSATVTGLPDYLTYIFRVSAINAVGQGTISGNSASAQQFNDATGGTLTTVSNYNGTGETWKIHTFSTVGNYTFTLNRSITANRVLVVAGGGGGGSWNFGNGGGGAGGMIVNDSQTLAQQTHTVTVGGGGAVSPASNQGAYGRDGGNSVLGPLTAIGGGGGAGPYDAGRSGGSGGGAFLVDGLTGSRGAGTAGQGNNGGGYTSIQASNGYGTGGGGGAGSAGGSGGAKGSGAYNNITGTNTLYAQGGGGRNSNSNPVPAADPYFGSGGYGGGEWGGGGNAQGTVGRSGIVVVAYRIQ